jgi:hypothetical protein
MVFRRAPKAPLKPHEILDRCPHCRYLIARPLFNYHKSKCRENPKAAKPYWIANDN